MIYYNARILNSLLTKLKKEGNEKLIETLKYISPVAWININLYGYYKFEEGDKTAVDIAKLADSINLLQLT